MPEIRTNITLKSKDKRISIVNYPRFLTSLFILILVILSIVFIVKTSFRSIHHSNPVIHSNHLFSNQNTSSSHHVTDVTKNSNIDNYLKSIHFNGTVLVVKNNNVLINKGYGYANIEKKNSNNSETVFYIASITKLFVSTAIMQLQEQGKLNIHDTISKYIPNFPNGNVITLYQLLTHTSGIAQQSEPNQKISHEDLLAKIEKLHLKFQPGSSWFYSDSNYVILAYILEKVTHQTLDSYIQNHIFTTVGMEHTGYGNDFNKEPYQTTGYKINNGQMIHPSLPDMSQLFGCADIYTTPYNLYLFDKALYNGKLVSKESVKQIFTPVKNHYGFGIYRDPGSYSDHGVLPGFNLENSFNLTGNEYVILFSNVQNGQKSFGVLNQKIYNFLAKV